MAPTYVVAYNPTDSPVTVDAAGRSIGGHEWAPARRGQVLDDAGNRASVIVVTRVDPDTAGPDAAAAARQVEELNGRADAWDGVELELVRDVAKAHLADVLYSADELDAMDRADVVDLLVRGEVDPPPGARRAAAGDEQIVEPPPPPTSTSSTARSRRGGTTQEA